jgi:hypothetical protein
VEGSCEHGNEPSGSIKILGITGVSEPLTDSCFCYTRTCFTTFYKINVGFGDSSVGIATGYGLDDQGGQEFASQ